MFFQVEEFFVLVVEKVEQVCISEDVVVSKVGCDFYNKFFCGYICKQWGLDFSEFDVSVIVCVFMCINCDNCYFVDIYQVMLLYGYIWMFQNMFSSLNIKVMLNIDYCEIVDFIFFQYMIYIGLVDVFFDFCYGKLFYCSLEFRYEMYDIE